MTDWGGKADIYFMLAKLNLYRLKMSSNSETQKKGKSLAKILS
jgi:hypothetical protein